MPTKPDMAFPESRGDLTLDPFQLDALRPLLLEQEMRIKSHFDCHMERLTMLWQPHRTEPAEPAFQKHGTGLAPPDEMLKMRAGASPHLIQLIERVKAKDERPTFTGQVSLQVSLKSSWQFFASAKLKPVLRAGMRYYDHFADLLVLVYSICLGVQIHYASMSHSEPVWAQDMEIAFCIIFFLDLLARLFIERMRFFRGHPKE